MEPYITVPTSIVTRNGRYYARINSLTNSSYSVIWNPKTFGDVADHWSKQAVNDMASRKVINGISDDEFKPAQAITRAEFAAIAVRMLGLPENGSVQTFSDVAPGDWFYGAVSKAYEYGIIEGYEDGRFQPLQTITRQEAMAMMARMYRLAGAKPLIGHAEANAILSGFADRLQVSDWALEAAATVVKAGLAEGDGGRLMPERNMTRAETAMMAQRLLIKAGLIDSRP